MTIKTLTQVACAVRTNLALVLTALLFLQTSCTNRSNSKNLSHEEAGREAISQFKSWIRVFSGEDNSTHSPPFSGRIDMEGDDVLINDPTYEGTLSYTYPVPVKSSIILITHNGGMIILCSPSSIPPCLVPAIPLIRSALNELNSTRGMQRKQGEDLATWYTRILEYMVITMQNNLDLTITHQNECNDGNNNKCYELGIMYYKGESGLGADTKKSSELFGKACKGSIGEACNYLGVMYELTEITTKNNNRKASGFYKKACDGGIAASCNNLGVLYLDGEGFSSANKREAELYFKSACDLEYAEGCFNMGKMHFNGEGGLSVDIIKAMEYGQKACKLGYKKACIRDEKELGGK